MPRKKKDQGKDNDKNPRGAVPKVQRSRQDQPIIGGVEVDKTEIQTIIDESMKKGVSPIIQAMESQRKAHDDQWKGINNQVDSLNKLLRGNGTEGLVGTCAVMKFQADQMQSEIKHLKTQYSRLVWGIIGALATSVGGLTIAFLSKAL